MKAIILAAGYATRLYPLTENFPKPLLEIGGSTILGRLLADLDTVGGIDSYIIVTNHRFAPVFEKWAADCDFSRPVTVVDDGTSTNETRLGAVRDLLLAIDTLAIDDDIMVMAGDNILDFSLKGFADEFHRRGTSMIMCHHEPEVDKLRRTGVIQVDGNMRVLMMQEKPAEPVSHWAVPPFYIYRRDDLPLVKASIDNGCGADAPGSLARYLCDVAPMHAWPMPGARLDIGSLDTYHQACEKYKS